MGSLAAHRGDRAEATGLFHPFSHSVPLPTITYSILLNHAHTLCVSLDANLSLSPPFFFVLYLFLCPLSCIYPLFFFLSDADWNPPLVLFFLLDFIPSLPHSLSSSYTPPFFFFSSHLPLSLPCPPYVSPLNSHVRCCCAVDKTQSLSHPSCTWDPWLCGVCAHVPECVCERNSGSEIKRKSHNRAECCIIH